MLCCYDVSGSGYDEVYMFPQGPGAYNDTAVTDMSSEVIRNNTR